MSSADITLILSEEKLQEPVLTLLDQETHECDLGIYVSQVPLRYTLEMLKTYFEEKGRVKNLKVVENREFRAALRCIYLECEDREFHD